jgi:hypothetical protein
MIEQLAERSSIGAYELMQLVEPWRRERGPERKQ